MASSYVAAPANVLGSRMTGRHDVQLLTRHPRHRLGAIAVAFVVGMLCGGSRGLGRR